MTEALVEDPLLVLNGIDVETGGYLTPELGLAEVADALRGDRSQPPGMRDLRRRRQSDEDHLGVVYGRDPQDLASVGWGVVVPPDLDPTVLEALGPLLRLREEQAGDLFRRLELRPGEDKEDFLSRHGMGPSVVDPRKLPYYLLLLGSPTQVPFDVQYQLGVPHAVGRLDLADPGACAAYATTVVAAERRQDAAAGAGASARRLHLFATRHPGDVPTALSASRLVEPLHTELRETAPAWQVGADVGAGATRARLEDLLTGPEAPDLLFTASHGMGGGTAHRDLAGALLCQDWPGPLSGRGPVDEEHYLAGHHLSTGTAVRPGVVFSFACFGAGTPQLSEYPGAPDGAVELAAAGFTARLPQRLLGAPAGGALAFVGHVDRAWSCSFLWKGLAAQVTPFQSTLLALMDGARLGWAMESLTSRYAEIATELTRRLDDLRRYGKRIDDASLVGLWTATHDARAYVVLGDPAVRVAPRGGAGQGTG
ncbi:hypothetical protein [Geodermatophilus sp. SYSU D01105]